MSRQIKISIFALMMLLYTTSSWAICKGRFLNPITDICWECIFPIKIGGITVFKSPTNVGDPPDALTSPICACPLPGPPFIRIGITTSFWEPAYIIETTKDPGCFPSFGFSVGSMFSGLEGVNSTMGVNEEMFTFSQANFFRFYVWQLMSLLTDFVCVQSLGSGVDLAYTTIIDPTWQSDIKALIISPETLLFANPIAQASCTADSAAVNSPYGLPINELPHCMGSWGSVYPLTGHVSHDEYVQSNAGIAARLIYKLSRQGQIRDTALSHCTSVLAPVWVKWHYRLQIAIPVRGRTCFPVGRSGLTWDSYKNPPLSPNADNFAFILFRKQLCCAF